MTKQILDSWLRPAVWATPPLNPDQMSVYKCPICESVVATWMQGSVPGRNKRHCPVCKSKPRQRMVWIYLRENNLLPPRPSVLAITLADTRNHRVLHVAPEESLMNELKRVYCSGYYGCDVNSERPGVEWVFSIENIPFKEEFFDIVICNHVLEHVDDDRRAMDEFGRVLKPGGVALVTLPIERGRVNTWEDFNITSPADRAVYFGQEDHVRRYGTDAMKRLVGDKFSVKRFLGEDFPTPDVYGLRIEEPLFVFSRLPAKG